MWSYRVNRRNLFLLFISIVLIDSGISGSQLRIYRPVTYLHYSLLISSIIVAFFIILIKSKSIKHTIVLVLALLTGLICYCISGNTDFLYTLLSVVLVDKENMDQVLSLFLKIKVFLLLLVAFSSLCGLTKIGNLASSGKGPFLGFDHHNGFAGCIGIIQMLYLAVNRNKLTKIKLLFVTLISAICFLLTRGRISFLLVLLTVVVIILTSKLSGLKNKFLKWSKYVFPFIIVFVFSLILLRYYSVANTFISKVDYFFNSRIFLSSMYIHYYPITLLGNSVDVNVIAAERNYYALDNGLMYLLVYYGIIGFAFYCFIFQKALLACRKNKDFVLVIITVSFMIWSVYEVMMVFPNNNFMLLFAFANIIPQPEVSNIGLHDYQLLTENEGLYDS